MTETFRKVISIVACIAMMFTMMPALGLAGEAHATSADVIFTHDGDYEITMDERANPPAAQTGDYLTYGSKTYMYSSQNPMAMFLNGNSPDPFEYFVANWIDDPNTFEPGGTYYFRYYLEDYNMEPYYSQPIAVKIKADVKTPTAIEFTQKETYMVTPAELDNAPAPVKGDKITATFEGEEESVDFTYGTVEDKEGFFNEDKKTLEEVTGLTLSAAWNEDQTFEIGDEPVFTYKLGELKTNEIKTKIVKPVVLELTLSSERTVDRADVKAFGKNAIPAEQESDTLNVILRGKENLYTHDGMEFVNNGSPLYDLVGSKEGHEWAEGEDFTGETAKYHYYVVVNGRKYLSNNVEVKLTGEFPVEAKDVTAIEFTPASEYKIPFKENVELPKAATGDKMKVTFSDESEDEFTFNEKDANGADFYNKDGKSLSQIATDDWEAAWLEDQSFVAGGTVYFRYSIGQVKSNDVPVTLITEPVPSSIAFTHTGDYTMEEHAGDVLPALVDGDAIEVTFSDESKENFIYSSKDDVFVSETKQRDIESLGLALGQAWNDGQKFEKDNTVYFKWSLGDLKSADIPVLVVGNKKEEAADAASKAEDAIANAKAEEDKAEEAAYAAKDAKKDADKAAKNETLKESRKAAGKAVEAAENAVEQAEKSRDAAYEAKKAAEDALEKAKDTKDGDLIDRAQKALEKANYAIKDAERDLKEAEDSYKAAISLQKELAKKNNLLNLKMKKATTKKISLKWNKINGAKKYIVYGAPCKGGKKLSKIKAVKGNKLTVKKIKGKKLKKMLLFILVFFVGLWLHKWTRRY